MDQLGSFQSQKLGDPGPSWAESVVPCLFLQGFCPRTLTRGNEERTETSDGEAPAPQTLGLLICTVEKGDEAVTDRQTKRQGDCIRLDKEAGFANRSGSRLCRGAAVGVGGEKVSETFSAHSVSTFTWTQGRLCPPSESQLEPRRSGPCHAHSHVHSMNSLKTSFAPCAVEALLGAHLISRYRLPS